MDSLKSIIAWRRSFYSSEPFPRIILSICSIDATALMSCSGKGLLVLDHILTNSVPSSQDVKNAPPLLPTSTVTNSDWEIVEPTFDFHRDLFMLWTKLGHASRQIRQEIEVIQEKARRYTPNQSMPTAPATITRWTLQTTQLREAIKLQWNARLSPVLAIFFRQMTTLSGHTKQNYDKVSRWCSLPTPAHNVIYKSDLYLTTATRPYRPSSCTTQVSCTVTQACGQAKSTI